MQQFGNWKIPTQTDLSLLFHNLVYAEIGFRTLTYFHSIACIIIGVATIVIPHSFFTVLTIRRKVDYNHMSHEYMRLYGVLTLGIGWLVWRCSSINDGRVQRIICETFAICYGLQALVMIRAQIANPNGHSLLHTGILLIFAVLATLYGYLRYVKKIKSFELPGVRDN